MRFVGISRFGKFYQPLAWLVKGKPILLVVRVHGLINFSRKHSNYVNRCSM
jgi:hypothetical protein